MRLLLTVLVLVTLTGGSRLSAAPPNMVFLMIDDLGYSDVGFHGSEIKTPHIDKLAANGARLEAFYVQPVCSPTRASLMTGRYPMRYGLQVGVVRPWAQYGLPLDERTLPQALQQAGYRTAISGKWHLGHFQREYLPTQRGFHQQYGHYNGALDYFTHERDGGFDWHRNGQVCRDEGYATTLLGNEAVRVIEQHEMSQPMFMYVAFNAPHTPLQAPQEYLDRYSSIEDKKRRTYAAMVSCVDDQIGKIVAALEKRNMLDQTLIAFSSDNGGPVKSGATNGSLRAGKGTIYEGGVRVSAFAHWRGQIKPGTVVTEPLHMVDWYPTLIKLAGGSLEQKLPIDGRDAWPTIAQGKPTPHDEILLNTTPTRGGIRMGQWKLVINGGQAGEDAEGESADAADNSKKAKVTGKETIELFDLATDPNEKTNVADRHEDVVKKMRARLDVYTRAAVTPKSAPKAAGFKSPKIWGEFGE